jgi:formylglycine-generating enzyme
MERKCVGRKLGLAVVACAWVAVSARADVFKMPAGQTSLEMVPVGDPGNVATSFGDGAVSYGYNIGKYEVTAGQYTAFLNAVGGVDTNALYNTSMWSDGHGCKIERYTGSGTAGSLYQYRVAADYANRPVNYVSFWDACRFANWLQNGQTTGTQDAGTTESGAYSLNGVANPNNGSITRNTGGQWAVTSKDEWCKAAYYKGGSTNAGYWLYPTSSNSDPSNDLINPDPGNNANFRRSGFTIDSPYYRTAVGEFENSESPYGTFDQGGNVWEWNEVMLGDSIRGLRGGSFYELGGDSLKCGSHLNAGPTTESYEFGFRVSQVPEPASLGVLGIGVIGLLASRRHARR